MTSSSLLRSLTVFLFLALSFMCSPQATIFAEESAPAPIESVASQAAEDKEQWSREWLESRGITFAAGYRAEVFSNLRGGTNSTRGSEYLGSADTTITFDLAKLHFGRGSIVVSSQHLHGRSINDRKVGAIQAASNLDNPQFGKLVEAYFTDHFLNDRINLKFGRLYADSDFNGTENGADFLGASYGLIPTVPMPTYPSPELGASLWTRINDRVSIGAGLYRGAKLNAIDELAQPLSTGLFTVVETQLDPFPQGSAFHGSYRIGVWQQGNSTWSETNAVRPVRNYGIYATGDHWFRKTSSGANSGPGVFFQLGWAPSDRNEITSYFGLGTAYAGFLPQRSRDSVGIGVTQARLSSSKQETVLEIFYKFQATKHVFVQPDIQWISRPAGEGHATFLGGLRLGLTF